MNIHNDLVVLVRAESDMSYIFFHNSLKIRAISNMLASYKSFLKTCFEQFEIFVYGTKRIRKDGGCIQYYR